MGGTPPLPSLTTTLFSILIGLLLKYPESYLYRGFDEVPVPQGKVDEYPNTLSPDASVQKNVKITECGNPSDTSEYCMADYYLPAESNEQFRGKDGKLGAVILGHGFASTRDMGLQPIAEYFANQGLAVLTIDYRRFGQSTGEPRHWIHPPSLVDDFVSAVTHMQNQPEVDPSRVCIWGTSFGGGHVLVAAAKMSEEKKQKLPACVISQMPYLATAPYESKLEEMAKRGWFQVFRMVVAAVSSYVRPWLGLPDLYFQLYGHMDPATGERLGEKLAMNYWEQFEEDEQDWLARHYQNRPNDWRNGGLVSGLFSMLAYRPIDHIPKISKDVPVLFVNAGKDKLCPTERIKYAATITPNGKIVTIEQAKHFTLYLKELGEQSRKYYLDFLIESIGTQK